MGYNGRLFEGVVRPAVAGGESPLGYNCPRTRTLRFQL